MSESNDTTSDDGFWRFLDEFAQESDRAAVIVGAAKLDVQLEQLIRSVLRQTKFLDELMKSDGPLGTFSSRIQMAHCLGLIDDDLTRSLDLIRKIRNDCAHKLAAGRLGWETHRNRIRELCQPIRGFKGFDDVRRRLTQLEGEAGDFRAALAVVCGRLDGALARVGTIHANNPQDLIPRPWKKGTTEEETEQTDEREPE